MVLLKSLAILLPTSLTSMRPGIGYKRYLFECTLGLACLPGYLRGGLHDTAGLLLLTLTKKMIIRCAQLKNVKSKASPKWEKSAWRIIDLEEREKLKQIDSHYDKIISELWVYYASSN